MCKTFLNDKSWLCENLNEIPSYIWNWQILTSSGHNFIVSVYMVSNTVFEFNDFALNQISEIT